MQVFHLEGTTVSSRPRSQRDILSHTPMGNEKIGIFMQHREESKEFEQEQQTAAAVCTCVVGHWKSLRTLAITLTDVAHLRMSK